MIKGTIYASVLFGMGALAENTIINVTEADLATME